MIKIKAIYNNKSDSTICKINHKHSCTLEVLGVIYRLMDLIEKNTELKRKDIYKYLKIMEEENAH